jgi:hypothetical protein
MLPLVNAPKVSLAAPSPNAKLSVRKAVTVPEIGQPVFMVLVKIYVTEFVEWMPSATWEIQHPFAVVQKECEEIRSPSATQLRLKICANQIHVARTAGVSPEKIARVKIEQSVLVRLGTLVTLSKDVLG